MSINKRQSYSRGNIRNGHVEWIAILAEDIVKGYKYSWGSESQSQFILSSENRNGEHWLDFHDIGSKL